MGWRMVLLAEDDGALNATLTTDDGKQVTEDLSLLRPMFEQGVVLAMEQKRDG